jgi:hypothetical protein
MILCGWLMEPDLVLNKSIANNLSIVGFTDVHTSISILRKCVIYDTIVIRELIHPKSVDWVIRNDIAYKAVV